jgi:hypothetical protein
MPIKCESAKKKVTINELVMVNEYGIKPTRFDVNMNINRKKSSEKY